MDRVARLPAKDRAVLFEETAARARLADPILVEKDFWVCWILLHLDSLPGRPRLLFKGGTSLSKGFGLIHRFSEDIDLGIERADIGLTGALDPMSKTSRKGYQDAVKSMAKVVNEYVASRLVPLLRSDIESSLGRDFELELEMSQSENVVIFRYPRALDHAAYRDDTYIAPAVRLELGARSDHRPTAVVEIAPYAAAQFPDEFGQPTCRVVAQAPERTLLEKALILHSCNCKAKLKGQVSRHAYDLAMMHHAGVTRRVSRELYEEVAHHKFVFGDEAHSRDAPTKGIRLVPAGELEHGLRSDYLSMQPMLFTNPLPPSFEEVLQDLQGLETALRAL